MYVEKLVRNARHVEVQVLGDTHGTVVHLYERDCTVQRRNQKVVERAPAPYLDRDSRHALCESALRLMRAVGYTHRAPLNSDGCRHRPVLLHRGEPARPVEHTVTEMITGIDIVKAQIRITEGGRIGLAEDAIDGDGTIVARAAGVPEQHAIPLNGNALQCRITTEIRRTTSCPITAGSPRIAARPASACGSMRAPPMAAR